MKEKFLVSFPQTSRPVSFPGQCGSIGQIMFKCTKVDKSVCKCAVYEPHVVGALLCRLSPVDAHTVSLKPLVGK